MGNSILDQVLANSTTRIVSQEDDTSKIFVDPSSLGGGKPSQHMKDRLDGMKRRGPASWDRAEYGKSYEEMVAGLQKAYDEAVAYEATPEGLEQARLTVEKALNDLIQRGIDRADLDTTNGKVAFASTGGIFGWHRLGTVVDGYVTGSELIKLAHCNWTVEVRELSFDSKLGPQKSRFARSIVRTDSETELGSVGMVYTPFQNQDAIEFGDAVAGRNGCHWETMGSVAGGKRVFALMKFDRFIQPVPGDVTEPYFLMTWTHDGSGKITCIPTGLRVCCKNTTRLALMGGRGKGFAVAHTPNLKDRLADAAEAYGFMHDSIDRYSEQAKVLVNKRLDVREFANDVLDTVLDVSAAEVANGKPDFDKVLEITQSERDLIERAFERRVARRKEVLEDIIVRYENDKVAPGDSAWRAVNAVTESVDHGKMLRYRGDADTKRERRMESIILGDGNDIKERAYQMAFSAQ